MSKEKLKDIGEFKNGLNFNNTHMVSGCKIIGVKNFKDNYIANFSDLDEVDSSIVSDDFLLKNGDILFVRSNGNKALVGRTLLIKNINEKISFSGFCIRFRPNLEIISAQYLLYLLKTPFIKNIFSNTQQTNINNLNQTILGNIAIDIPSKKEQEKIINILHTLTTKIDCNNRINAELEAMAKTLYDYWFVQFDFPNKDGKPYKASGGTMQYNEELKRDIPKGWRVGSLWDIAKYHNGLAMQKYRPTGDEFLPVIKIREMNEGISDSTEKAAPTIPPTAQINDGDVLFSWSATLDVKIWTQGKGALNQHIFKVVSEKHPRTFFYFELLSYLNHFKMMAEKRKTTMGHITLDHLKQSRIVIPPQEMILQIHEKINPILEKNILLQKENQELAKLRDWLLPMLMNGQVSVI